MTTQINDERYIEAPSQRRALGDGQSVFLAGGITGCGDWQKTLAQSLLHRCPGLTVLNPRRDNFPIDDPTAANAQIAWEFYRLSEATCVSFWFTNATIQPIALFELGRWSHPECEKPIFVGVEPGYLREHDVRIQMALAKPHVRVVSSLSSLADQIERFVLHTR